MRAKNAEAESPSIAHANRAPNASTLSAPPSMNRVPPHEASAVTSLTERVAATFRFAVGLEGPKADPQQKITVETFLRGLATQHPEVYLSGSASASYGSGAQYDVTESSAEWTLARGAMAKVLAIHLVQCKFGLLLLASQRAGLVTPDGSETPPSRRKSARMFR